MRQKTNQKEREPKSKKREKISREEKKTERYIEAVGRRKTAIARVRVTGGQGNFSVNGKGLKEYFRMPRLEEVAAASLSKLKIADKYDVSGKVFGGGMKAQAEALRLGVSRALAVKNSDFKPRLRKLGFLTRDSRMVERKKYGFKKARRAPQWKKR